MGVDLFFVLSGFLITGILWDAKHTVGYFRNFYARRVLRIFPAYYFVLLVFFVVLNSLAIPGADAYLADSVGDQVWHWTYLSNFRIAWRGDWYHHHMPNVFWSLAIEEQFYLVWPVIVLACSRRVLMRACVVLFAVALGMRIALAYGEVSWVTSFVLTPTRMDGLVVGAFLALLLLTVTSRKGSLLQWLFAHSFMRMLGKFSYALYLWHGPVDTLTRSFFDPNRTELILGSRLPVQLVFTAVAGTLSLIAAWLSWQLIEKHFLALKNRFASRPRQTEQRST
jgi:peptidoglycan/LPS O-acetylase OafA/YrhL